MSKDYSFHKPIVVVLSSEESKRIIAKGIALLPEVIKARREGIIGLAMCSSAGYVAEELLGKPLDDLSGYCSGYISKWGYCFADPELQHPQIVFSGGEVHFLKRPKQSLMQFLPKMGHEDIIIKSGNALDLDGNIGVLVADPDGGEIGQYLGHIYSQGIRLIIPMTINKTIPVRIKDISNRLGVTRLDVNHHFGLVCGMIPITGKVITEIEALKIIANVDATPIVFNGFGSGSGTVSFLIEGDSSELEKAWNLMNSVKGEPPLRNKALHCENCPTQKEDSLVKCNPQSFSFDQVTSKT
jgi:hypothetical protein